MWEFFGILPSENIPMQKQSENFVLKISLLDITPKIWRELVVPAGATFFELHVWLQNAMGWTDSHLHQFWTTKPYGRGDRGPFITYPYPDMEDAGAILDERKEKLSTWFTEPKTKLWYEYDFGDEWLHEIVFKKTVLAEKGEELPRVVAGARACPPEDCSGVGGYEHLCTALADPKHPDYKELSDWLMRIGRDSYDPEKFDPSVVRFLDPKQRLREFKKGFGV